MKTKLLIIVCFCCACGFAQVKVPFISSSAIIIDGIFDNDEWKNAERIAFGQSATLHILHTEKYIYIGIVSPTSKPCYTDLYLASNIVLNLHASMQLGERIITSATWNSETPAWNWGNNSGWIANTVKFKADASENQPFEQQIIPYHGQEFRIEKNRLSNKPIKIRIETKSLTDATFECFYPAESEPLKTNTWAELVF